MSDRRSFIVGGALLAASAWAGGRDSVRGIARWHTLGPLPPGVPAPNFRLFRLGGGTMSRDDLAGAVNVMTFWATWCGVCRTELADLDELATEYAQRKDVRFLAVNHEGGGLGRRQVERAVTHYQDKTGLALPVVMDDGSTSKAFRVRPIPHTVLLDREGMIRYVHVGRVSASTVRAEIERLLEGD